MFSSRQPFRSRQPLDWDGANNQLNLGSASQCSSFQCHQGPFSLDCCAISMCIVVPQVPFRENSVQHRQATDSAAASMLLQLRVSLFSTRGSPIGAIWDILSTPPPPWAECSATCCDVVGCAAACSSWTEQGLFAHSGELHELTGCLGQQQQQQQQHSGHPQPCLACTSNRSSPSGLKGMSAIPPLCRNCSMQQQRF